MRTVALLASLLAFSIQADQPLQVIIGTGDGKEVKPSIYASGKVEVRVPTLDEIGEALAYPGVGSDNFKFRARQVARCNHEYNRPDGTYGNQYATVFRSFDWGPNNIDVTEVKEYREVDSSSVIGSNLEAIALNSSTCDNRTGGEPLTCNTSLSRAVTNSLTRTSTSSQNYTVSQAVNYRVGSSASPAGAGGETKFAWSGTWGESTGTTSSETISAGNEATTTVPPGGLEKLTLYVEKGTATFEVKYAANFEGSVVVTCPDGRTMTTTVDELYSGGIPHLPFGRCPWCSGPVAVYKPALDEKITVTQYTNARISQESGD